MAREVLPLNEPVRTRRDLLLQRWGTLHKERASWWSHWKEITDDMLPRSGRYFRQDRNKGGKRHNAIYDNTTIQALRTMAAGMMAGATSPARPWFRLAPSDPEMASSHAVKTWLNDVRDRMLRVFRKSNTYRVLHQDSMCSP